MEFGEFIEGWGEAKALARKRHGRDWASIWNPMIATFAEQYRANITADTRMNHVPEHLRAPLLAYFKLAMT